MPTLRKRVRQAKFDEHSEICRIAKQSKYTKDFSNMIFSGQDCYAQGRIRIALVNESIAGFSCFRNRKRDGVTVLYFLAVDQELRNRGVGNLLMHDLWNVSTGVVEFKVMKDNPAVAFYVRLGYVQVGEAYDGQALVMRKDQKETPVLPGVMDGLVVDELP